MTKGLKMVQLLAMLPLSLKTLSVTSGHPLGMLMIMANQ
jgi:hypothetical protein